LQRKITTDGENTRAKLSILHSNNGYIEPQTAEHQLNEIMSQVCVIYEIRKSRR
jgi:hypothetical protein